MITVSGPSHSRRFLTQKIRISMKLNEKRPRQLQIVAASNYNHSGYLSSL